MGLSDEIPPIQICWFETFWKNALFNGVHDVFFLAKFLCFFFGTHITEIIGSGCSPATPLGMTLVAGSDARSAGENGPMCTYHMVPGCYRPSLYLGTRKL